MTDTIASSLISAGVATIVSITALITNSKRFDDMGKRFDDVHRRLDKIDRTLEVIQFDLKELFKMYTKLEARVDKLDGGK